MSRISYRSHPILKKIKEGSLGIVPTFERDKNFFSSSAPEMFFNFWKKNNENFKNKIFVIQDTFYSSMLKAEKQLTDLYSNIVINDLSDFNVQGTFLYGDFVFCIDYQTKKGTEDVEFFFYIFDKKGVPLTMYVDSAKYKIYQNGWISNCFKDSFPNTTIGKQQFIFGKFHSLINISMFKTYASVEVIESKSKTKNNFAGCKYLNETDLDIEYLDSKWFTTLVNSQSFKVRGFFRLQPKKKDGEWTKELIWINEFEKKGYTRQAKILNQNENVA